MATVRCPSCDRALEVEDTYLDWTVRCPHCDGEFVPDEVERPARRPRRRREEPPDRDRDDRDDGYAGDAAREEALRVVAAPALWLEILGWLGALGAGAVCALCVALGLEMNNGNRNANGDDEAVLIFFGCCSGVLGVPYSVVLAIGARKMRDLSSRGWALTAGILGVAAFSVFGLFGIVHAGVGVWALVTLDRPAVRAVFGLEPRRRPNPRRRRRDWEE
ncbi:MAG: hypothetical protein J0I06_03040 [Planctomycetes bacterium]|nr:hypothetical protein [Planctomycetota bacterium]